jgi:hypothetical protein
VGISTKLDEKSAATVPAPILATIPQSHVPLAAAHWPPQATASASTRIGDGAHLPLVTEQHLALMPIHELKRLLHKYGENTEHSRLERKDLWQLVRQAIHPARYHRVQSVVRQWPPHTVEFHMSSSERPLPHRLPSIHAGAAASSPPSPQTVTRHQNAQMQHVMRKLHDIELDIEDARNEVSSNMWTEQW